MSELTEGRLSIGDRAAPSSITSATSFRPTLSPTLHMHREGIDPLAVRRDFPILEETINGRPLVWLDNAATTQKPRAVIDRLVRYYLHENSNAHRSAYTLATRASEAYESARETTARFLNAAAAEDIVFVRGATEGIKLVAHSWGRRFIAPDDEIVITCLEHHGNIVPWHAVRRTWRHAARGTSRR